MKRLLMLAASGFMSITAAHAEESCNASGQIMSREAITKSLRDAVNRDRRVGRGCGHP